MTTLLIDLNEMTKEVVDELASNYPPSKIKFQKQNLPSVFGDPTMIRQVMVNLIDNAVKYSSRHPQPVVEIGCHLKNGECVYYVKDNGAGFDMKYADKLFGVFQRLHTAEDFAGTGVGLAIVQRIIKRHHGRIWSEAKVNEGATFFFTLSKKGEG